MSLSAGIDRHRREQEDRARNASGPVEARSRAARVIMALNEQRLPSAEDVAHIEAVAMGLNPHLVDTGHVPIHDGPFYGLADLRALIVRATDRVQNWERENRIYRRAERFGFTWWRGVHRPLTENPEGEEKHER